jgi:hypothetical protein
VFAHLSSFVTPRLRFLHVPRTGGVWIGQALIAAGVAVEPLLRPQNGISSGHAGLRATGDYADRFTLAYVRHPLEWWRSLWVFRMRTGWVADHLIDSATRSEDFNDFVSLVVERLPGHFAERSAVYIGEPEEPISYIGRFESLLDDLVSALTLAGESFDEAALRAQPPANANDYACLPALYEPELAVALAGAEHRLIERFYADDPVPGRLLAAAPAARPARPLAAET